MMTFYHAPGSCSNGILMLLDEVGASYQTRIVDLRARQQLQPDYLAVNAKGKVPALLVPRDGLLTEFPAIAYWIATSFPDAGLWPDSTIDRTHTLEALDFIVGSVHMRGFTFVRVPQKFLDDPAGQDALRAYGRREVSKGLAILSELLGDKDYLLGAFGIADAALSYVLDWATDDGFDLPDNLARCRERLRGRGSVIRTGA
jgi:glutathione S-transferase